MPGLILVPPVTNFLGQYDSSFSFSDGVNYSNANGELLVSRNKIFNLLITISIWL